MLGAISTTRLLHPAQVFNLLGAVIRIALGKFIARHEVYTFFAQLLNTFDVCFAIENRRDIKAPQMELNLLSSSVMGPIAGDDASVRVRQKLA